MTRGVRGAVGVVLVGFLAGILGACSAIGGDSDGSVFGIEPGQCFLAPEAVEAQISDLDAVKCTEPHHQESYAVVPYESADADAEQGEYPGDEALARFAEGACAAAFGGYVGVDYLDSSLFFTYLAPSPRSWQEKDRSVICFATAAGRPLEKSVRGSER